MLVVTAILAVLFAFAGFRAASMTQSGRLGSACRGLGGTMRQGALLARQRDHAVVLRISAEGDAYALAIPGASSALLPESPVASFQERRLPTGIRIESAPGATRAQDGTLQVVIAPHGAGTTAAFHLSAPGHTQRTVFVHPVTNALVIAEGHLKPEDMLVREVEEENEE
ncbi:MAG: hypothetical protein HY608_05035 [Planctomycetes bacterium]|nr:hypothetical protein [Planctomycetota bacterium]